MSCLNKDPADRPQSAEAFSQALDDSAISDPWNESRAEQWWNVHSPSTHVSSPQLTAPHNEESLSLSTATQRRDKGGVNKWVVMALALAALGWGLWLTLRG